MEIFLWIIAGIVIFGAGLFSGFALTGLRRCLTTMQPSLLAGSVRIVSRVALICASSVHVINTITAQRFRSIINFELTISHILRVVNLMQISIIAVHEYKPL